jgi:hypothetical protein
MRRCLLRRQTETSGEAFSRFWQHFHSVSFKGRFRRHLTTHCGARYNSLTLNISPFLPESENVFEQAELILRAALDPAIARKARRGEFVMCLDHFDLLEMAIN